ncbi:hypothetical protein IJ182_08085 [bacterium]|nr:hypothetical protein [bacterium]
MKSLKYVILSLVLVLFFAFNTQNALSVNQKILFATETADAWAPTFQLCWNELIKIVGTSKVEFVNGNPELANELNKQKFNKTDISEDSYYISVTKMTLNHKKEIEKAILNKFKEKSDILNSFKFENIPDEKTNKWFIYSILLKNFKFVTPYNILDSDYFNKNTNTKYKYFGFVPGQIDKKAKDIIENGYTESLFYVNDDDFALKLIDKNKKDEMIIYLSNSKESLENVYNEILEKSNKRNDFIEKRKNDIKNTYGKNVRIKYNYFYKIPFMHINEKFNFDKELAGKPIKDKTYNQTGYTWTILKTLQTIKFDMDNEGAKLKSEAAIAVMKNTAVARPEMIINLNDYYYFDRPFFIYLKESGKDKPYFAAKVKDGKYLVKAAK